MDIAQLISGAEDFGDHVEPVALMPDGSILRIDGFQPVTVSGSALAGILVGDRWEPDGS
jgi:hypothetical protein